MLESSCAMPHIGRFPAGGAALLVVDIQAKLVDRMRFGPLVIANTSRLIHAARALEIPVFATEQYPQGLGPTVESLQVLLPHRTAKTRFSAFEASGILAPVNHVTLVGIETHVCILQTALDFLERGYRVQIPADAVSSRGDFDRKIALRRMEHAGATLTTTEAVLFEWVGGSDHPVFKTISLLVRDFVPPPID